MCTLSWRHEAGGYHLLFNRDERKTRRLESGPSLIKENGRQLIAPRDADHGGTWLAVNEHGVTYALLNHYDLSAQRAAPENPTSRGVLPIYLGAGSAKLSEMDLQVFPPFHLVRVAPNESTRHWIWDGESLSDSVLTDEERPLTTSSFDSGRAIELRSQAFQELGKAPSVEALAAFHRSSSTHGSPYGVLMRRDDAQTMSITHVEVTSDEVVVDYEPQAREPRDTLESTRTCMPRVS